MHSKKKVAIGTTLAISISAAVTIYVFRRLPAEAEAMFPLPFSANKVVLAATLLLFAWLVDSVRLKTLARSLGRNITVWNGLQAIWAGNFLTLVTPFLFGGAPATIYVLKLAGLNWVEAGAIVAVGGWLSQIILVCLSLISVLGLRNLGVYFPWQGPFLAGTLFYLVVLLGLLVLLTQPKLAAQAIALLPSALQAKAENTLRQFYHDLSTLLATAPFLLIMAAVSAIAYFTCLFSIAPTLLMEKVPHLTARAWWYLQNIAYIGPLFAPTPGASGASELWQLTVFSEVLPPVLARQYLLLWRLLTFYLNILVGGIAFALSGWHLFASTAHTKHN